MYSALFRALPGSRLWKIIQMVILAALVLVLLFGVVFPAVETIIPQEPALNG